MRKKQLLALLMASALSVGMAPTAAFAADTAVEAEGEVEGALDAADTEEPADETPAEDPAVEEPTEEPAQETPAQEETPAAEETDAQDVQTDGAVIVVGDDPTTYTSLAKAFEAAATAAQASTETIQIKIQGDIEIDAPIDVSAGDIQLVAVGEATIRRASGYTGSMFTVSGGNLQIAGAEADETTGAAAGTLTVDGTVDETGDGVTGSIVEVTSGNFALSDGATLTGNATTGNGGAINNAAGANVYLLGGSITGNSAAAGGGIYSEGTVSIQGTVNVTGNTADNVVLNGSGVINVTGAVTDDSVIGVSVQDAAAGKQVVKLADGITDVKLADVISKITYEGNSDFKIGDDGTLVSTKEEPEPTPDVVVTIKKYGWTGHNSAEVTFESNVKGKYYIEYVKHGASAPTIDTTKKGSKINAGETVTKSITKLPEYDVDIYVCVVSEDGKHDAKGFALIGAERPPVPVTSTPTPTPTHTPVIADINKSVIQGFENALVFYPNTFYEFRVIGAGTQNSNPGQGDVRWVPVGWSTVSANPTSWKTTWKIGAEKGIYTDKEVAYSMYVRFRKDVYDGSNWQETDSYEVLTYQFKAAPLSQTTVTPGADGSGTGGDGMPGEGSTDITPTTYADGTNGTSKSAVSTGDESPIGTMMALAAASVLAGGYVLVRRRKKEQ